MKKEEEKKKVRLLRIELRTFDCLEVKPNPPLSRGLEVANIRQAYNRRFTKSTLYH